MSSKSKWKTLFYMLEKLQCYSLVFFLTPCYFIFHLIIVRPQIVEMYEFGTARHWFHIIMSSFCFMNVVGNMFMAIFTDTSLKMFRRTTNVNADEKYCELCKKHQPPKSWHCDRCNICILRRDHHCFFFSRCVGLYNQRYYILYLIYILISVVYSTYYDYFFISSKYEDYGFIFAVVQIFNPVVRLMTADALGIKELYVLFFILNLVLVCWITLLVWFHVKNAMAGITAYEFKSQTVDISKWKTNMLMVFGTKWYLAIFFPFVDSPFPEVCSEEAKVS
ncbi:probable palmitoyltransferase ZDHHC24 [Ostrinia furnacalis]|uniref:probable palmitoyltransferase ZDHHC24 n=1 Tax=Ostrinia furnacalis TaxID=93504 RepID=UPI00103A0EE6|nr:probable palmitoyltransferase ZDHHC24 [Ostrinia furnacalis]